MKCNLDTTLIAIKWVAFVLHLAVFVYFVVDIWEKFSKKSTNFMSTKEAIQSLESPTFVLCPRPQSKKSVLLKYNISESYFSFINQNPTNEKFTDIYHEASYQLGEDIEIMFSHLFSEPLGLQLGNNEITNLDGNKYEIIVTNHSTFSYGFCYKVSPKIIHTSISDIYMIIIKFNDSLSKDDVPQFMDFIITSKANSYGAGMSIWREGQEFVQSVALGDQDFLRLKPSQNSYVKDSEKCQTDDEISFYNCSGNEIVRIMKENSSQYCLQINNKMIVDLVTNESLPICGEPNTQNMMSVINVAFEIVMSKCKSSCSTYEFDGKKTPLNQMQENGTLQLMYMFETMEIQVREEYIIYDFIGMIGGIGGTLGLFVGFSFFDAFCWLLEKAGKGIKKYKEK